MHLSLGVSLLLTVPILLFGLFSVTLVWINDSKSKANRLFLWMVCSAVIWAVISLLSFAGGNYQLVRLTSNVAAGMSYIVLLASFIFTEYFFSQRLKRWITRGLLPASLPLFAVFLSNYTCGAIDVTNNCKGGPTYRPLIAIVIFLFAFILKNCIVGTRSANQLVARQARIMLLGFLLSLGCGIVFGYFLPLMGITTFNGLYSLSALIFIGFAFYAIVRHRLFDVRLVIARAIGYGASIVVLASLYGFAVFSIARLLFGLDVSWPLLIFLSATTGIAGLLFQRLRNLFDSTTSRVFYHDAYDPQELFDQLNKVLVSSLDLQYMLKQSARVLDLNIKAEYCFFAVRPNAKSQFEVAGTLEPSYDLKDTVKARKLVSKLKRVVVVTDYLAETQNELKALLTKNNMAVVVRLTQTPGKADEGLGYIVLGPKKSGNAYNGQDIRVLDTVANELIVAIQNALHFEEIQNFNVTLQNRVERATKQLRSSNQRLKELDETKDDFISMASHQLRTPLTSVKGYISMVMEGDAGKVTPTQETMLKQAFSSSQRMVYLIADLLNVSRIKTGKFVIEAAPTDLCRVVQEEVEQLSETAELRGVSLAYNKPSNLQPLMLDETKIRQVVMNFLDNAIYYTPAGGHIAVQLTDTGSSIELTVTDDGIGVPKALQHNLFNKFFRAPNAQKARPDGTGLGLFMAKKVIVAEGGALLFKSQEGKGSMFGFTFSKAKLAPPPAGAMATFPVETPVT